MKKLLLILSLLIGSVSADSLTGFYELTNDIDGVQGNRYGVIWLTDVDSTFKHGARIQTTNFSQNDFSSSETSVYYVFEKEWNANNKTTGYVGTDKDSLVGFTQHSYTLNENYSFDAFAERGIIDSELALDNSIYYTLYGGGINYDSLDRFSMSAYIMKQNFTDGTSRDRVKAIANYAILKDDGWFVRGEYDTYDSSGPSPYYFSPDTYSTMMVGPYYSKWFGKYQIKAFYLVGTEDINDVVSNNIHKYEIRYKRINDTGNTYIEAYYGHLENNAFFSYDYAGIKYTYHY